jgi:predicted 2-oxoglutarate/Fe(II)-dependent dioxygenase YbiX
MPLTIGADAPKFYARTHARPDFAFGSLGGLHILLAFLPEPGPARDVADKALATHRSLFDDSKRVAFGVVDGEADFLLQRQQLPGLRFFHDPDNAIARAYGLVDASGAKIAQWVLVDPMMRVLFSCGIDQADRAFSYLMSLGDPESHAGTPLHAPVLIVPRVFEPEFCRQLIDVYIADGGGVSGVMRDIGGKTVGVIDDFKKRRDATIGDENLKVDIQRRISVRLLPQIEKAFMFKVTRMERYIVARYDSADGGYFKPHRDNTTRATAHRQFACSINLNAEDYEGGDLRFPEFGRKTYRPPTGGAVIFSCSLLHEATPVVRGERFAFLPFFYDDASAAVRQRNLKFLEQSESVLKTEAG